MSKLLFPRKLDNNIELRLLVPPNAAEMYALINSNREHLRRWLNWVDEGRSVRDARLFISQCVRLFATNGSAVCGIWYCDAYAGSVSMHVLSQTDRRAEIGYWIGKEFEGKGIVTTACREMITYAFQDLRMNRIDLRSMVNNHRSRAVAERLGFKLEGILRQQAILRGEPLDMAMYSLLRDEWEQ